MFCQRLEEVIRSVLSEIRGGYKEYYVRLEEVVMSVLSEIR